MEKNLEDTLQILADTMGVTGCIVSDKQGLSLACKGMATPECAGLFTAIDEFAKKLHPKEAGPVIVLENNEKQCLIQSNDRIVVAVYKDLSI